MHFESANPSIVKSIRQRDLLNHWLRLYARLRSIPRLVEYQPARLSEEWDELVYYTVEPDTAPPRLIIESEGTRMSRAYGQTGKGRYLDDYVGARLAPVVMPFYHECLARGLPVYTICELDDAHGRVVAYERLLLPFTADGSTVAAVIASLKTISEDGAFEIKNLMRDSQTLPSIKLVSTIDRDLFHRVPGRVASGDVIELN